MTFSLHILFASLKCRDDENFMFVTAGFQIRTRQMVNKGGEESSCGPRDEIRSCRLESCFSWKIRDDGPCKLSDVHSSCGAGRQNRIIECAKWDGVGDTECIFSSS